MVHLYMDTENLIKFAFSQFINAKSLHYDINILLYLCFPLLGGGKLRDSRAKTVVWSKFAGAVGAVATCPPLRLSLSL